jgi:MoaA/NifB/PqqE/SkfB family radical SAM enzyme
MVTILANHYSEPEKEVEKAVSPFVDMLKEEGILTFVDEPSYINPVYDYSRPSSINIEITYKCNEYCIFCASNAGVPEENELTDKEIDALLDEIISLHITPITITGGEPLLKKDLVVHMVEKVHNAGLTPNLLTNGTLVTPSLAYKLKKAGINSVQVSLDGANPETNDTIRGRKGGFEQTVRGIHALKGAGIAVSISAVLTRENFHELEGIYNLGETLGVPVLSAEVSPTGRGFNKELLLTPQQICEHFCYTHTTEDNEISMLAIPREQCAIGTSPVVTPTGDVYTFVAAGAEAMRLHTTALCTKMMCTAVGPLP